MVGTTVSHYKILEHLGGGGMGVVYKADDPWTISGYLKQWDLARKGVDEYISRHPDDPYGYKSKANILIYGFGDLEGARAVLEEGMRLPLNQYRGTDGSILSDDLWLVNYYQGKYEDALTYLVGGHGEDFFWGRWLSWTPWLQKGLTYVALNQRASAMACFDSALSFAERSRPEFRKHYRTGIVLALRGEHDKLTREFEKADSTALTWVQRKLVEEARARAAVLAGDTEKALNLLEQLIAQPGFLTVWKLRLDPVYNPLRSDPRFQALLAKAK